MMLKSYAVQFQVLKSVFFGTNRKNGFGLCGHSLQFRRNTRVA